MRKKFERTADLDWDNYDGIPLRKAILELSNLYGQVAPEFQESAKLKLEGRGDWDYGHSVTCQVIWTEQETQEAMVARMNKEAAAETKRKATAEANAKRRAELAEQKDREEFERLSRKYGNS